tara:strand:+ start:251 stop:493 length:243 start_codon:yes stop_codon:yes gene_type:complete
MKLPNNLKTEPMSAFLRGQYEIAHEIYTHFGKRIAIFESKMGTGLADDTWEAFKNAEKEYSNVWVRDVRYTKRELKRVTK